MNKKLKKLIKETLLEVGKQIEADFWKEEKERQRLGKCGLDYMPMGGRNENI